LDENDKRREKNPTKRALTQMRLAKRERRIASPSENLRERNLYKRSSET
jgi:hypothetical protein